MITALNSAPFDVRQSFGSLALSRLADAYLAEIDQARNDIRGIPAEKTGSTQRWTHFVERYVDHLLQVKGDIDQGLLVTFITGQTSDVVIDAGGQRVMLSSPRPREQQVFEQTLLESFCRAQSCDILLATEMDAAPLPERIVVVEVRPEWTFATDRIECRHNGLTLAFAVREYSDSLRQFCDGFFRESETLLGELRKLEQFGMVIEWGALAIRQTSSASEYVVEVNAARDSIPLNLPVLYAYPKLLLLARPWLQSQLQNQTLTLSLAAKDFGWGALDGAKRPSQQ